MNAKPIDEMVSIPVCVDYVSGDNSAEARYKRIVKDEITSFQADNKNKAVVGAVIDLAIDFASSQGTNNKRRLSKITINEQKTPVYY